MDKEAADSTLRRKNRDEGLRWIVHSCGMSTATPAAAGVTAAWLTPIELTLLGAIWGASFMFQRVAAPQFGPVPLVELRLALGSLPLLPFLWSERARFKGVPLWRIAGVGAINSAIPFMLFAWATERAPAGIGAISNATTAIFAPLLALIFFGEKIQGRRAIGIAAGFIGVVVLASGKTAGGSVLGAALAGTFAGLLYAIGALMARRYLAGLPSAALAAATLGCGAIMVAPFAIATWPATSPTAGAWWCAVAAGVLCTGIAFAIFYRLLQRIGAPRASGVTYLISLFGVFWGWLLLGEPVTLTMAVACALILGGVALSQKQAAAPVPLPVQGK
jgi:drug/metabolite transporter (DMT)-like permease